MASVSKERRLYGLQEANRTLPLVSRIVRDIVDTNGRMRELHLEAQRLVERGDSAGAEALQDRLQALGFERADFKDELEHLGIELKDPNIGLIDFPAMLDGRIVYLCWRLGEQSITHWHELKSGYSGRRSIDGAF